MAQKRHQGDTKTFAELRFPDEQRSSILGQLMALEKSIKHYVKLAEERGDAFEARQQCSKWAVDMAGRILKPKTTGAK